MRGGRYPDMPFNGQMTVPFELSLRTLPQGVRLVKTPVKELERLRYDAREVKDRLLGRGDNPLGDLTGDAFDLEAELEPRGASAVVLKVRGTSIEYVPGLLKCLGSAA